MRNKIIKLSPEIAVSKSKEYRNENKMSRQTKVAKKSHDFQKSRLSKSREKKSRLSKVAKKKSRETVKMRVQL